MDEILIEISSRVLTAVIVFIAAVIFNKIKNGKNEKLKSAAEYIAGIVENIYRNCPSDEKLAAFKALCKEKGVDVDKAVKYLEDYIIPMSKKVNYFISHGEDEPPEDNSDKEDFV